MFGSTMLLMLARVPPPPPKIRAARRTYREIATLGSPAHRLGRYKRDRVGLRALLN